MKLKLIIKNGERKGELISLSSTLNRAQTLPWLKENEAIEFSFTTSSQYSSATLELYEHSIEPTRVETHDDDKVTFIWSPLIKRGYQYECLFINYFGVAELNVKLTEEYRTDPDFIYFQPIEILSSKVTEDKVEEMFNFLSQLPGESLHSIFSATRHGVGLTEGTVSPEINQERLEIATTKLQNKIVYIIKNSITRLVPEYKTITATGDEDVDDKTLGWLLENLSVLSETDNLESAHIYYDEIYYSASSLQIPVLANNTNLYENQVIHGYINLLLYESQELLSHYTQGFVIRDRDNNYIPDGYSSFFDKVSRFKNKLVQSKIKSCEQIIDELKKIKLIMDMHVPVSIGIMNRPIITPKVNKNHGYRDVFVDIIQWHEKGIVDWSVYDNLFAIQSIPKLFETYCFYRVAISLNELFGFKNKKSLYNIFLSKQGFEISILREPKYWISNHKKSYNQKIANSEGWTIKNRDQINPRSHKGPYAHRAPDIVIKIVDPNGFKELIILDAKYTNIKNAFINYLPELTMKYVHGIHKIKSNERTVNSLTIIHPDTERSFRSFHDDDYNIFGQHSVSPSLQCIGVTLGEERESDYLSKLLEKLLYNSGVTISNN